MSSEQIPYMLENTREEFERVRDLAWPAAPLSSLADHADERFTEAQLAKVADFEAADAPESSPVVVAMLALAQELEDEPSDRSDFIDAAFRIRCALEAALDGKP